MKYTLVYRYIMSHLLDSRYITFYTPLNIYMYIHYKIKLVKFTELQHL